jgi:hypothetical protein
VALFFIFTNRGCDIVLKFRKTKEGGVAVPDVIFVEGCSSCGDKKAADVELDMGTGEPFYDRLCDRCLDMGEAAYLQKEVERGESLRRKARAPERAFTCQG